MAWTPPSKFIVFLTFLIMAFGVFIFLDQGIIFWNPPLLPAISLPSLDPSQSWSLIGAIVVFLSWFLFFLGVKFKGI